MAWWTGRGPTGRRWVIGLVAILAGACARAPDRLTDIPPGASAKEALGEPVRWVHHPTEASEPAARLPDGGCIVVAPRGRWLVRPSDAARRQLSSRGNLVAVDPTACVGIAEFVPEPGRERTRRVVVDGDVVHVLSLEGTLRRALSPRSPFEVVLTPTSLVDVGASRGALLGVALDGGVLRRVDGGWRGIPAGPRDVVELGVLGGDVVALSLPERYTLLADGGATIVPMDATPEVRAAFRQNLSVATCLWRRVDRRRGQLELVDYDPRRGAPHRRHGWLRCRRQGVRRCRRRHLHASVRRSDTRVLVCSGHRGHRDLDGAVDAPRAGREDPCLGASPSRDGLVVWRGDGTSLDVLAGPYGAATPPWQRVRGNDGMWTEDGLVTWTWVAPWQGRPPMLELGGHDATGSEIWSFDTVTRTASAARSWYDVRVIPWGGSVAIHATVHGERASGAQETGWAAIATVRGGAMGRSTRLAEVSFPGALPACTEEQRRRHPRVPVTLARGGARGRIEVEGAFGSARLQAASPIVYGVEPSCIAAWSTTVCDASPDAWPQVTLTGDLRSGAATLPLAPGPGHQRFRLACVPP